MNTKTKYYSRPYFQPRPSDTALDSKRKKSGVEVINGKRYYDIALASQVLGIKAGQLRYDIKHNRIATVEVPERGEMILEDTLFDLKAPFQSVDTPNYLTTMLFGDFSLRSNEVCKPLNWQESATNYLQQPSLYIANIPYWVTDHGRVFSASRRKVLTLESETSDGYYLVPLSMLCGHRMHYIHRLVAFLFCPNSDISRRTHVHHIDTNKANNKASNLLWVSPTEHKALHKILDQSTKRTPIRDKAYTREIKRLQKDNGTEIKQYRIIQDEHTFKYIDKETLLQVGKCFPIPSQENPETEQQEELRSENHVLSPSVTS